MGSAKQGDRRVVFAFSGVDSQQARAEEGRAMINWAFRQFAEKSVTSKGEVIAEAEVFMGASPRVRLTPANDVAALLPVLSDDALEAEVVYDGPLIAPIAEGDQVAELIIKPEGLPEKRVPLVAAETVARGGFVVKMRTAASHLLERLNEGPEGAL